MQNVRAIASHLAGAGLVPPAAAVALLGKGGAVMIVLIILMAITYAFSLCIQYHGKVQK